MKRGRRGRGALLSDCRGLETVEYAILAGLITATVIAAVAAIGLWIAGRLDLMKITIGA